MPIRGRFRYVLFDLDNTLYSRESGVLQHLDARIEEYLRTRFHLAGPDIRAMRTVYWQKYGTTLGGLLAEHHVDVEEYLGFIHDIPVETLLQTDPALDRLLAAIVAEKIIFTNATREHARRVLAALGISRHFRLVFDIRDMGYITKPRPEAYQSILATLGAKAEECVFVDDSLANLSAAKSLGMCTIQVGAAAESIADYVIPEIGQLAEVMKDLGLV